MVFPGNYDDQNENNPSMRASIPSDVIHDDVLRLFVVANIAYEDDMNQNLSLDSLREVYPDSSVAELTHAVVDAFYTVKIDEKEVPVDKWYFHYKTKTKQRGYLTYLDISYLDQGLHSLQVLIPDKTKKLSSISTIPFYRDAIDVKPREVPKNEDRESTDSDFQPKPFGIRD